MQHATCNTFIASNEHKLIHTFIHSQLSNKGYQHKITGLRDIYDFYLLTLKVNTKKVIQTIEEKKKAQVFANYVQYLMTPIQNEDLLKDKKTKQFVVRHHWYINHPRQHHYYINTLKLYELIFNRYLGKILCALFQKSAFKYIINRLKDPHWYKKHFNGLRDQFK